MGQLRKVTMIGQQENGETCSRSRSKLRTLPIEEPPVSLETAERRIDMPIEDSLELRTLLIYRCERIVQDIIEQLSAGKVPSVSYRIPTTETLTDYVESLGPESWDSQTSAKSHKGFTECRSTVFDTPESMELYDFQPESQDSPEEIPGQRNVVDFSRKTSKGKFALMMRVLMSVHHLLIQNKTETRRSLFYELKNGKISSELVNKQTQIDSVVASVANLLECSPWDTGLVGTAKGLAAGDLRLTLANKVTIDYNVPGGAVIPQMISNVTSIKSKAELVIVVEKDTTFQKLLQEKCPSKLNCILVTGKGYPDVATRMLIKVLAEKVGLAVYILVDADPYGMEIMFNYKYGSVKLCRDQGSLACPSARWVGVRPSELDHFKIPKLPLTDADIAKLNALQSRTYIGEDFSKELELLRKGKAEIEAIEGLTSMYLPLKITSGDYV